MYHMKELDTVSKTQSLAAKLFDYPTLLQCDDLTKVSLLKQILQDKFAAGGD